MSVFSVIFYKTGELAIISQDGGYKLKMLVNLICNFKLNCCLKNVEKAIGMNVVGYVNFKM